MKKVTMNKDVLVSVVMCCYNAERFIGETIESILIQTYGHFEFIIWNDGSKDRTEEIVLSYCDKRIRYFYHENTGVGIAANLACKEARGKYIARIDSDDIAEPQRLEMEVDYLEKHPKCVLLSSAVTYIDEQGSILARSYPYTWNVVLQKSMRRKMSNPFAHSACMFRRLPFIQVGYPRIRCFEDAIMCRRLSQLGRVCNLSETLLRYRVSSDSLSHRIANYLPLIRAAERLVEESDPSLLEQNEKLFDVIYTYAKNNSKKQMGGFYKIRHSGISSFSSIMSNTLISKTIIFFHNILGLL